MKSDSPRISVVMVTYNSAAVLESALDPLYEADGIEILIRDNASQDETLTTLRHKYPKASVIAGETNVGFARAVNEVAAQATAPHILLLNPDARIVSADLFGLVKEMETHNAGIASPLVRQPQGRLSILEAGRTPTIWRVFTHWSGLSRFANGRRWLEGLYLLPGDVNGPRTVGWVSGACMLIDTGLWEKLRGLTERWFMYAEDTEFCLRAHKQGANLLLAPQFEALHVIGASTAPQATRERPRSDWVVNLYELYVSEISRTAFGHIAWRAIVIMGLYSRAIGYWLRARGNSDIDWRRESRNFRGFAHDLRKHRADRARSK